MLCLILANGDLAVPPGFQDLLDRTGLIIAADGGAEHCVELGVVPDMLIGDLDSVSPETLERFEGEGVSIERHPPEKDATDLELALDLALARGATAVWLLGVLGGRWDMSLANILLAAQEKYRRLEITLAGSDCRMHIIHSGKPATIRPLRPGMKVSILPLKGDARGVSLDGFKYPLHQEHIPFGSSRGVSNIVTENAGTVRLEEGVLLCVCLDHE